MKTRYGPRSFFTNGRGIAAASSITTNSAWPNLWASVGRIYCKKVEAKNFNITQKADTQLHHNEDLYVNRCFDVRNFNVAQKCRNTILSHLTSLFPQLIRLWLKKDFEIYAQIRFEKCESELCALDISLTFLFQKIPEVSYSAEIRMERCSM